MHVYDFEVLFDGAVVAAERAVRLADARLAWTEVGRLARLHAGRGVKIRVTDETGHIVILTGVASVLRHAPAGHQSDERHGRISDPSAAACE